MADNLTNVKDWTIIVYNVISALCTVITAICAVIALFYVNIWRQAKERDENLRREKLQNKENLRKEKLEEEKRIQEKQLDEARRQAEKDANKVAGVLSQEYDEAKNIFSIFKEKVDKLKRTVLVGKFTEFHVLSYMCHWDNNQRSTEVRSLLKDVEKIVKLFFKFRIQLAPIQDKECPQHIKDEFSREIIEMGQTIFPLVSNARQKVIKVVLAYFGSEHQDLNSLATEEELKAVNCILPPPTEQHETETLPDTIRSAIPYLVYLGYQNGVIWFKPPTAIDSCLGTLEVCLQNGNITVEKKQEILNKAKALWPESSHSYLNVKNLLHLIRMIMFKLVKDPPSDEETENQLHEFLRSVKNVVNVTGEKDKKMVTTFCQRALMEIERDLRNLQGTHKRLLEEVQTRDFLTRQSQELETFMRNRLQDTRR